ncbi:MAG: DUF2147 domain-containing protein [Flavimaricola sp.]|nr:DUF2147 domain-containing protein [Flavimaricola sp.]
MKMMMIAVVGLVALAGTAMADPLEGLWRTTADDNGYSGLIEVAPCGAALCGTLIRSFDASGAEASSPNIGRQIISETVARGGGEYRGKVWAPDRDRTYNSRLMLDGDSLAVSGCVLGICRDGGTWTRAN